MKNILILAGGSVAKHFIDWIGKKRVAENHYYITYYKESTLPKNIGKNITLIKADPTSYSKLSRIMNEVEYSNVFIIMDKLEDAQYTLKNIALIDIKIRTVFVNQWDNVEIERAVENLTVIYNDELIAGHLYEHLPNVPLVAQNVGLGQGEIMEIHVPFGSSYSFRHVGSILQRKWKIVSIYRDEKQILPTTATIIRPNDRLLVVGKPLVLDGVYKTINKRIGLFPEPFGKDIYLLLDFRYDQKNAISYLKEAKFLLERLENKSLFIRILYPNDFALIDEIKSYETENITIAISYDDEIENLIEYDINQYDIGMIMNSIKSFESDDLKEILYDLKKLVYLFADELLCNIKKCVVLMDGDEKMESISASAFDISESLGVPLMLADFDPEADFKNKKRIIEHYETLAHIFNVKIEIEEKVANPIRELANISNILQIAPFEKDFNSDSFIKFISTKVQDFILTTHKHPKLLVPFSTFEHK